MITKKIAITGSTGLIGTALVEKLLKDGHNVLQLTRGNHLKEDVLWDPENEWFKENIFEGIDVLINLSGHTIGGRLTNKIKNKVYSSRIDITNLLIKEISKYSKKPKQIINASATGYYGNRYNEEINEQSTSGFGFLSEVPNEWEKAANQGSKYGIKIATTRFGLVLSKDGGFLNKPIIAGLSLLKLFQFGIAGKLGNGKQWMPWISLEDTTRAIAFIINHELDGPINIVGPTPTTNYEFTKTLGGLIKRPTIIPIPALPLKIIFGEFAKDGLLGGQKVSPKVLLNNGFKYNHETIEQALIQVIK